VNAPLTKKVFFLKTKNKHKDQHRTIFST